MESRAYLQGIKEQVKKDKPFDKEASLVIATELEAIAEDGCECETNHQENIIRSQAYTQVAAVYGIIAKGSFNVNLGMKSFDGLKKARELDPNNTDAIKGQAIALNKILSKNWGIRKMAAVALGMNLKNAARELISDLREYPDRKDLNYWANQLEKKL